MNVPLAPVEVKLGDGMFLSYPLIFVNLCYNLRLRRVTGTGSYSHVLFDNLKFGITTRSSSPAKHVATPNINIWLVGRNRTVA